MEIKDCYKRVIADLTKKVGKKCKCYSVGCFVCQSHRMAEDLRSIYEIIRME